MDSKITNPSTNPKTLFIITGALQAFTAVGAIPAGIGYLIDTSGGAMGVTPELLKNSPLTSFLLPGLFLLLINGFANIAGAVISFRKSRHTGITAIVLGLVLSLWIVIQVAWIGLSSFLQPLFFIIGLTEALIGWRLWRR